MTAVPGPGQGQFSSTSFVGSVNPSEQVAMSRNDMVELMQQRFGPDAMQWCFYCPRCGLVQSGALLEPHGSAVKAQLGQMCVSRFRDGSCLWTALTPQGGPMTIKIRTDTGSHTKPSMRIAPAGMGAGDVVPVEQR